MKSLWRVIGLCLLSVSANATLISRSGGLAYYDDVLNITWLTDANYAQTSGYDADGRMTWSAAQAWIGTLNTAGYLGVSSWRLPTVTDTGASGCPAIAYAGTDCGFNVDVSTGEMAHLYYSTLGNAAAFNTAGVQQPCATTAPNYCLTNRGPFTGIDTIQFWSGTPYAAFAGYVWTFQATSGYQYIVYGTNELRAWAVASGDATVPVPPAVWLFGSALGLMGVARRKVSS